jgi:hypothetical protein
MTFNKKDHVDSISKNAEKELNSVKQHFTHGKIDSAKLLSFQ